MIQDARDKKKKAKNEKEKWSERRDGDAVAEGLPTVVEGAVQQGGSGG